MRRASKKVIISTSLESLIPICFENIYNTSPLRFLNTPSMPAKPGFHLSAPSTLNLRTPTRGGHEKDIIFFFEEPTFKQVPQLCKILSIMRSGHSFLRHAHLAILNAMVEAMSSSKESLLLKILLFLSFHMDQRIEMGMSLHRVLPHPTTGESSQASRRPAMLKGKQHSTPQALRKTRK